MQHPPSQRPSQSVSEIDSGQLEPQIGHLIEQAKARHFAGRLAEAREGYELVLQMDPGHMEGLYYLGIVALQTREWETAAQLIGRAIAINPQFPDAYCNLGIAFKELKRLEEAIACHDQAIHLKPDFAEAYFNRGHVLRTLQRHAEAIASYENAIRIRPSYAEACFNLGLVRYEAGQFDKAIASFDLALRINPQYTEAYIDRGSALQRLGRFGEAVSSYQKAVTLSPDRALTHNNLGNALQGLHRYEEAIASYDIAIRINPAYADPYTNRGNVLTLMGRHADAIASHQHAIDIKPDFAEAYCNLGNAQQEQRDLVAAVASYDKAIALRPNHALAFVNRGNALQRLNQFDEALASFDHAIRIDAQCAAAHWGKSLIFLLRGDYLRGWPLYEWRSKVSSTESAHSGMRFSQPLWLGDSPLQNKTVLLHSEQGIGDTLQMGRYIKSVAEMGARVIVEVDRPLVPLFEHMDGIDQLIPRGGEVPGFDVHCPMMSLPLAFKTELHTIPSPGAYLSSDIKAVGRWSCRLGEKRKPRIGLTWSGNALHKNDQDRSLPLATLLRYLPGEFEYVCLQKELRTMDRECLQASPVRFFGDDIADFSDTAALCALMDVVISVDTSVAHLAGAMGCPTWILLAYSPDFRWLLNGDRSPWYDSVRLFRQEVRGEWTPVLQAVAKELAGFIS
jgi:tetratricopeptide (TPR) repeat protein